MHPTRPAAATRAPPVAQAPPSSLPASPRPPSSPRPSPPTLAATKSTTPTSKSTPTPWVPSRPTMRPTRRSPSSVPPPSRFPSAMPPQLHVALPRAPAPAPAPVPHPSPVAIAATSPTAARQTIGTPAPRQTTNVGQGTIVRHPAPRAKGSSCPKADSSGAATVPMPASPACLPRPVRCPGTPRPLPPAQRRPQLVRARAVHALRRAKARPTSSRLAVRCIRRELLWRLHAQRSAGRMAVGHMGGQPGRRQ